MLPSNRKVGVVIELMLPLNLNGSCGQRSLPKRQAPRLFSRMESEIYLTKQKGAPFNFLVASGRAFRSAWRSPGRRCIQKERPYPEVLTRTGCLVAFDQGGMGRITALPNPTPPGLEPGRARAPRKLTLHLLRSSVYVPASIMHGPVLSDRGQPFMPVPLAASPSCLLLSRDGLRRLWWKNASSAGRPVCS